MTDEQPQEPRMPRKRGVWMLVKLLAVIGVLLGGVGLFFSGVAALHVSDTSMKYQACVQRRIEGFNSDDVTGVHYFAAGSVCSAQLYGLSPSFSNVTN